MKDTARDAGTANQSLIREVEAALREALGAESVEIVDESHLHAGHAGARAGGAHLRVVVVAKAFEGKSPLQRHRMVHAAVGDRMKTQIHALALTALAVGEAGP